MKATSLTFRHFCALLCFAVGGAMLVRHTGAFADKWDVAGHALPFAAGVLLSLPTKLLAQLVAALPFSKTAKPTDAA
jgi:hypothetical protein